MLGHFYRPPNSCSQTDNNIEQSIDLVINTGNNNIIITGDFNLNTSQSSSKKKLQSLRNNFGQTQHIDEPTHFTEHSSSIIDILLLKNNNLLLHCGVGDPFLDQTSRYHCPIYAFFKFNKPISRVFKRHVWLYDKGNYEGLRDKVSNMDWDKLHDSNIDTWVNNFTNYLLETSKEFIPNRTVTIRSGEPKWITSSIKRLIRKRKRLYRIARSSNKQTDWDNFRQIRNQIINIIKQSKNDSFSKLANNLNTNRHSKSW